MRTAIVAFVLATFCASVLTPLVRTVAVRFGMLDEALSARKIHGKPIPRLGGIAIVLGFYAPLLGLFLLKSGLGTLFLAERRFIGGLFVGGLMIAFLGVYDDLRGTNAKSKFAVQFAVAGLMFALGLRIHDIRTPFGPALGTGMLSLPITVIWIVGIINAMNLIDGLDGLAGGVGFVAVSTLFVLSVANSQPLMILLTASLAGAILGFLFYNFNPASIFMGDTGSMFLGFVLAASSLKTSQKSTTVVAMLIPLITLGLPLIDTMLAIARRALRGRPLFHADKEHIHHRMLALGLTQKQAVAILYAVCVLLSAAAIALSYASSTTSVALLLGALMVLILGFLRRLGYIRLDLSSLLSDQRQRNRALVVALRPHVRRLQSSKSLEDVWQVLVDAAVVFGATGIALELARADPTRHEASRLRSGPAVHSEFVAYFHLATTRQTEGTLELRWADSVRELDRDVEIAIELFCVDVRIVLERLRAEQRGASRRALGENKGRLGGRR